MAKRWMTVLAVAVFGGSLAACGGDGRNPVGPSAFDDLAFSGSGIVPSAGGGSEDDGASGGSGSGDTSGGSGGGDTGGGATQPDPTPTPAPQPTPQANRAPSCQISANAALGTITFSVFDPDGESDLVSCQATSIGLVIAGACSINPPQVVASGLPGGTLTVTVFDSSGASGSCTTTIQ